MIWATVRNLIAQGADEVFVIDDGSTDETVCEAEAAGATVLSRPRSESFSEEIRTSHIQKFIETVSAEQHSNEGHDNVWWIIVDADEFPRGPNGLTIKDLLQNLSSSIDVVGSRVLDHNPGPDSRYQPHTHPAESIPLARWYYDPYCRRQRIKRRSHWKHQLFRARFAGDVFPGGGRHLVGTKDGRRVREAKESLLMHHIPLREKRRTEQRLLGQAQTGGRYKNSPTAYTRSRPTFRLQRLRDLYAGRAQSTPNEFSGEPAVGLSLRDWKELVGSAEQFLPSLADDNVPAASPLETRVAAESTSKADPDEGDPDEVTPA